MAVSPVKPLGDYRVTWTSNANGLTWQIATEHGPLELNGAGSVAGRRVQVRVSSVIIEPEALLLAHQLHPPTEITFRP